MPGSYFPDFEHSSSPYFHRRSSDACPPLFLPVAGPSANPHLQKLHSTTVRDTSNGGYVSRKRPRPNECDSVSHLTPRRTAQTLIESPATPSSSLYTPATESPPAFVNTAYRIAGGLDTPTAARLEAEEIHEEHVRELDYRPNRMTLTARQEPASYFPWTPVTLARAAHVGRKRARSIDPPGWSRAVVNLVGGVAEKVFNFCWNGAFRGFQAGGGQAYTVRCGRPAVVDQNAWMDGGEKVNVFNKYYEGRPYHDLTPVPGQFPEEGFIKEYMSQPQAHQAHQVAEPVTPEDEGGNTLTNNWVVVDDTISAREQDRSPGSLTHQISRSASKPQSASASKVSLTAAGKRPRLAPSRSSLAGSLGSSGMRPASFAPSRATPRRSGANSTNLPETTSRGHNRSRPSIASPRRATEAGPRQSFSTPSSPDVERFAKQMRRKEKREDESIQRLNRQLQDMIKEGREALGTRVEVEDDPDEGGGYGGPWHRDDRAINW